jgi:preprotein translocase subunit YajC
MNFLMNAAYAADQAASGFASKGSGMSTLLLFGGIFLLFYVLIIRPQNKRSKDHRKMISALSAGDEVITTGGILGKILSINDNYISVEIAPNMAVRLQKSYVTTSLPKGTYTAIES